MNNINEKTAEIWCTRFNQLMKEQGYTQKSFLKEYKNVSRTNIVTQNYPGTNLKVMQIPIDQSTYFYDTPGLGNDTSILEKVEKQVFKAIVPVKKIEKRSFFSGFFANFATCNE